MIEDGFVARVGVGGPEQATVGADDNLMDRVEATVTGNELRVGLRPGTAVEQATLTVDVRVQNVNHLAVRGSARLHLDGVTGDGVHLTVDGSSRVNGSLNVTRLDLTVDGASTAELSGRASDLRATATGASELALSQLSASDLDVTMSGASSGAVAADRTLQARADGASHLRYLGDPRITERSASGASTITS
ncbi:GIN domain-containing protein [Actinomycetospora cinnamomea]|uniref:Putative autotransporter adhesin-like protein n=1 Tax=Actinomycetospora cinnamomea TaxID=663609 RepID=A0A2U1E8V6_9PSEU|nr:DUF2807 domain-containing protein [Actinomycetospora cinnamomea]PVY96373.1 putative autotransporter adhesin-like protein [Actinomycetospora cinnamomea]